VTEPQAISLADVYAPVVDALEAAEIRWNLDLQQLAIPGVLIPVPTLTYRFAARSVDVAFTLVAVVNNTGRRQAIEGLSELVAQVQSALAGAVTELRPIELLTTDNSAALLGAELPVALTLRLT
jgi:hypothetical protein